MQLGGLLAGPTRTNPCKLPPQGAQRALSPSSPRPTVDQIWTHIVFPHPTQERVDIARKLGSLTPGRGHVMSRPAAVDCVEITAPVPKDVSEAFGMTIVKHESQLCFCEERGVGAGTWYRDVDPLAEVALPFLPEHYQICSGAKLMY
ncbi:hypothetical protein SCUP515_04191 [Seiridium cupressi]